MEDEPRATANGQDGRKRAKGCGAALCMSSQSELNQDGGWGVSFAMLILTDSPWGFLGVEAPAQRALTMWSGCAGQSSVAEGCYGMLQAD